MLQSTGLQRVGHNWATEQQHICMDIKFYYYYIWKKVENKSDSGFKILLFDLVIYLSIKYFKYTKLYFISLNTSTYESWAKFIFIYVMKW